MTATRTRAQVAGQESGPPFDLLGPLPTGTTILEASAGTGKTFTIAGLVARYVAETTTTMDQLLVVSFSRESTRELRERVRERLTDARDALHSSTTSREPLLRRLGDVPADERALRRRRLDEAIAVFDAATVTTTHGFCQQMLLALGTAGDSDPDAVLVEDETDLVREVADDLYLRKWGFPGADASTSLGIDDFRKLAFDVASDPATRLVPDAAEADGRALLRLRIAEAVRRELDRRKRHQRLLGYDDMLTRLAATLADPDWGPAARRRLRERYQVVLVDEFQDTDPVQWEILRLAFHEHRTLVLIGDPKQAIYGFRGADVHSYLAAADAATSRSTLPRNWRSDDALLRGMAAVFGDAALGDARIRVLPVEAQHHEPMVTSPGGRAGAAVRLRVLPREGLPQTHGLAKVKDVRPLVARDVAGEVVDLLAGGLSVQPRDGELAPRPLLPGDIAVLVRKNDDAMRVQTALQEADVPVVVTGQTSVFQTPAAAEWQLLLDALEQPHRTARVRRLALGCFVGMRAVDISGTDGDAAADVAMERLATRIRGWARVFADRGVAALFAAVSTSERLPGRLLAQDDGERLLTDLRHLTEVLHQEVLAEHLGLTALAGWLRRRREDADREGQQERSRRLESDAAAVQVMTVHMSKGLEFPVVLVPFAWDLWPRDHATAVFHDEHDVRLRDVGGPDNLLWAAHEKAHRQEDIDDELRLTYVALTRAQSRLVLWWAPATTTKQAPLHRLLLGSRAADVLPSTVPVPSDDKAMQAFGSIAERSGGAFAVESIAPRAVTAWTPAPSQVHELRRATFDRQLDTAWRRTSYSSLTAAAHDQRFGSEPEQRSTDDEVDREAPVEVTATTQDDALRPVASRWDTLPGGTAFGTLVHGVLEAVDDPGDDADLRSAVERELARGGRGVDAELLVEALHDAVRTPLGALADDRALVDVPAADRLAELEFELPLAGGDTPLSTDVMLAELVPLWRRHCPAGSLSGYADVLAALEASALRGYLTGSIDAVLRIGDRHLVVDYKTNRLGVALQPLTAFDYRPAALEVAMIESHYPLQALLYDVALHRYLRWRLPAYDPAEHLGGVLYLFLRGMVGPGPIGLDGAGPGVFAWRPPTGLVVEASDLLAGRR